MELSALGGAALTMAQTFCENCSWIPSSPKNKMEKPVPGYGCCDLMRIRRSQDHYSDQVSVQDCVKLLEEFLADVGCAQDDPKSCRCRGSVQEPWSMAFSRRHEEERGRSLRSPLHLLRAVFLQMDAMCRWHKILTADPWIQDLLEMCCTVLVPRPRGTCACCRERQAVLSEGGRRHKPSRGQTMGRRSAERRRTMDLLEYRRSGPDRMDKDFLGMEERNQEPGVLASIQQLKNSLKKDLETHQLYLRAIETRLSGLERRAQDVTHHLERANLELEAIKHGSVALESFMDEQIPPVIEDSEDDGSLWQRWSAAARSEHPEPCRGDDARHRCASEYPTRGHRDEQRTGPSSWQRHVDVLIQQITQQIHQMESDIKFTSRRRQNVW